MQWLWALTVVLPSVRRGHEIWQSEHHVVRNCLHCGMVLEGRRVEGRSLPYELFANDVA